MTNEDYILPNHVTDEKAQLEQMNRVLLKEIDLLKGNVESLQRKVAALTRELARLSRDEDQK